MSMSSGDADSKARGFRGPNCLSFGYAFAPPVSQVWMNRLVIFYLYPEVSLTKNMTHCHTQGGEQKLRSDQPRTNHEPNHPFHRLSIGADGEFSKKSVIQYYKTLTLPNGREIPGFPSGSSLHIVRVDLNRISAGRFANTVMVVFLPRASWVCVVRMINHNVFFGTREGGKTLGIEAAQVNKGWIIT